MNLKRNQKVNTRKAKETTSEKEQSESKLNRKSKNPKVDVKKIK